MEISSLEQNFVDSALGHHFKLSEDLFVVIFDHLVLTLLLPQGSLQVGYPHLDVLLAVSVCLDILVALQPFNVEVDTCL
jgi:hypothetical protein